jgi:hypothetical protein
VRERQRKSTAKGGCAEGRRGGQEEENGGELLVIVGAKGGVVLQIVRDVTGRRFVGDEHRCGVRVCGGGV